MDATSDAPVAAPPVPPEEFVSALRLLDAGLLNQEYARLSLSLDRLRDSNEQLGEYLRHHPDDMDRAVVTESVAENEETIARQNERCLLILDELTRRGLPLPPDRRHRRDDRLDTDEGISL